MILIGTDEGIYRWFEGCGWPVFHALQDRAVVGLATSGAGVIVAVDRSGEVLESTNNGLDWLVVPMPAGAGRPTALAVQGNPPVVVVAVKPLSLYRRFVGTEVPSAPAEDSWVGRARGLAAGATALLAPGRSKRAVDPEVARLGGWTPLNAPSVARSAVGQEVRALSASAVEGGPWFAGFAGAGLWRSVDFGRTWTQCAGLPGEVHGLTPVPGRPSEYWAATSDGCRYTADAGLTWQDRSAGLERVRQVRAIAVHPGDPSVLYAGASPAATPETAAPRQGLGHTLYESRDAGKSWTAVVKRSFPEALEYDTINAIVFDPAAPDNAVVALGSGELWLTSNAGAYWSPLARQIRAARVLLGFA